jgi:hypothetical protein
MNPLLFILTAGLGLTAGKPSRGGGGHHRGADGHDQNCVDISRYSEVQYNASAVEYCTYNIKKQCTSRTEQVCAEVPVQTCSLAAAPDCTQTSLGQQKIRNDQIEQRQFVPKECKQTSTQTINQQQQRPVCKQVTKPQHCESKWVINDQGEKVWDGNENCQLTTTEECTLETYNVPIQVPVYTCTDGAALTYNVPIQSTEQVTKYSTKCQEGTKTDCKTVSKKRECVQVELKDCVDQIVPQCQGGGATGAGQGVGQQFQVPYQTFDHRLKCLV